MYHFFFILSSVYEHLGYFHILASVNGAEHWGICVFEIRFSQDISPGVRLLGHMVNGADELMFRAGIEK